MHSKSNTLFSQSHNTKYRGRMFAFQWREFSPPLSSAHRLFQCYHSREFAIPAAIPWNSPSAPATRVISQWERSLEWRHTMTLHNSGRENLHRFLPILSLRHALYGSIMTLWLFSNISKLWDHWSIEFSGVNMILAHTHSQNIIWEQFKLSRQLFNFLHFLFRQLFLFFIFYDMKNCNAD